MDQIVERRRHRVVVLRVVAVLHDDERRGRAGDVLRGNVNGDRTFVGHDCAGLVARNPLVDLAVLRLHREPMNRAARRIRVRNEIGRVRERRPQRDVAVVEHVGARRRRAPPRRPGAPRRAAIADRQHAEQYEDRARILISHLTVMTVCAVDGLSRDAALRSCASMRSRYRPGDNVLQRNAASVAEICHFARPLAVCQHVARDKRLAAVFRHQPGRHIDAPRLLWRSSCRKSPPSMPASRPG